MTAAQTPRTDAVGARHPHEPEIPPALDSEGRCLICLLSSELAAAIRERDLAIAHDRQPYPTAEAYEKVCAALAAAKALVKEWACEKCRTVYPGPPQKGFMCVICPSCNGNTMPHELLKHREELAAAKAEANSLKEALEKYGEHDVGCALLGTHEPCSCGLDNILNAISKE